MFSSVSSPRTGLRPPKRPPRRSLPDRVELVLTGDSDVVAAPGRRRPVGVATPSRLHRPAAVAAQCGPSVADRTAHNAVLRSRLSVTGLAGGDAVDVSKKMRQHRFGRLELRPVPDVVGEHHDIGFRNHLGIATSHVCA